MLQLCKRYKDDIRTVILNVFSLSVLEIINVLMPMVTLPYLLRVLGPERFGLVVFAQVTMQWLDMFVGYGFNLSATRDISKQRDSQSLRSRTFSVVLACKSVLILGAAACLVLLVMAVPAFRQDSLAFLIAFGVVVGNACAPRWFFQGIEKLKLFVVLSVLVRATSAVLILVLVGSPSDYLTVLAIHSLAAVAIGGAGLVIACQIYDARFRVVSVSEIAAGFRSGWGVFLSHFFSACYLYVPALCLGVVHGNSAVGVYAPAHRVVSAVNRMVRPVTAALFPFVCRVTKSSQQTGSAMVSAIGIGGGILFLPVVLSVVAFADELILFIAGEQYSDAASVLRVLAWVPVFTFVRRVFTVLGLVNFSKDTLVMVVAVAGLFGGGVLVLPLAVAYAGYGAAVGVLATEVCVSVVSVAVFLRVGDTREVSPRLEGAG